MKRVVMMFTLVITLLLCGSLSFAQEDSWESYRRFIEEGIIRLGNKDPAVLDNWLKANGIYKAEALISKEGDMGVLSDLGQIDIVNMDAYYSTFARKYMIKGGWRWKSFNYVDPSAGAPEALSISMHNTQNYGAVTGHLWSTNPAGIAVYDNLGYHYPNLGGLSSISLSALNFQYQDSYYTLGAPIYIYTGYRGSIWGWLDRRPTNLPFYLVFNYIHTWSSAQLTSLTFNFSKGTHGLSATWSIVPRLWHRVGQKTVTSWPSQDG